jgi:hypothetical protein
MAHFSFASLSRFFGRRNRHRRPPGAGHCRPRLEALEDRTVPSLTVSAPGDDGPNCLRAVLSQARPGDTIVFDPQVFAGPATIALTHGPLTINRGSLASFPLTIAGPGADRLTISGNQGGPSAGKSVLVNNQATVTVSGVTFAGGGDSGILNNLGTLTLDRCAVAHNFSANSGGGINNDGGLTLSNSTVSDNQAIQGGGIFNSGHMDLVSCTVAQNDAGLGGGIVDVGPDGSSVSFCTVAGNQALGAGGLSVPMTTASGAARQGPKLYDTIVADNHAGLFVPTSFGADISGPVLSAGSNLIQSTAGATITGETRSNWVRVDAQLGPLQDNGGPTRTRAPALTSPALTYGNPKGAPPTDQRGVFRLHGVEGTVMDIGAVAGSVPVGTAATHLVVTAQPSTVSPNGTVHVHVTALDQFNRLVPTYRGHVSATSSDPQAVLPAPVDFGTSPHPGAADFDVVLRTTGAQGIWVSDPASFTASPSVTVTVTAPTRATNFRTTQPGRIALPGVPFAITVSAVDVFNNLVPGYTGTVQLSDDLEPLSESYTFTAADQGTHVFTGLTRHVVSSVPHQLGFEDQAQRIWGAAGVFVYRDITAVNGRGITSTTWGFSENLLRNTASLQLTLTNSNPPFSGSYLAFCKDSFTWPCVRLSLV